MRHLVASKQQNWSSKYILIATNSYLEKQKVAGCAMVDAPI